MSRDHPSGGLGSRSSACSSRRPRPFVLRSPRRRTSRRPSACTSRRLALARRAALARHALVPQRQIVGATIVGVAKRFCEKMPRNGEVLAAERGRGNSGNRDFSRDFRGQFNGWHQDGWHQRSRVFVRGGSMGRRRQPCSGFGRTGARGVACLVAAAGALGRAAGALSGGRRRRRSRPLGGRRGRRRP